MKLIFEVKLNLNLNSKMIIFKIISKFILIVVGPIRSFLMNWLSNQLHMFIFINVKAHTQHEEGTLEILHLSSVMTKIMYIGKDNSL